MRHLALILVFCLSGAAFAANGDITAVRISGQTQRGVTDGSITSGAAVLTSATASFSAADVGKWVYINGAGAAGALLTTTITVFTNSTTVTVANNASTTKTANATVWIGNYQNGFIVAIDIAGLAVGGTYAMGLGANNSASTAKLVFTVTSPGYDATGSLGTIVRTIYGTKQVRKTYPNDASNDEVSSGGTLTVLVALSDFIYSGDTVTLTAASGFYTQGTASNAVSNLAATNNSTLAWSDTKAVGRWVRPVQYDRVTGNFVLEFTAFNRFARNGKPLAAVKMQCSDAHSHTAGPYTVTNMTVSTQTGDQHSVLVYAATVDVSTLTQGDVLTCNAKAYPWAGDATAVLDSNSGVTQPDARLSDLLLLNDKSGTYGGGVAVVDATNGHASSATTWVSANQAAAEASYAGLNTNSYADSSYATAAIKAYNNANLGRNEPGGGIILVVGLTNDTTGTGLGSYQGDQNTYLTITHLSTATRATAGFSSGSIARGLVTEKVKYFDLTLSANTGTLFNGITAAGPPVLWLDKNAINLTGTTPIAAWAVEYATRNSVVTLNNGFGWSSGGNTARFALVRGNAGPTGAGIVSDSYAMVGNANLQPISQTAAPTSDGSVIAFNSHYSWSSTFWSDFGGTTLGIAEIQNVVESLTAAGQPGCFSASEAQDASTVASNNYIFWHNTCMGERGNFGYNWVAAPGGATVQTNWSMRGNLWDGFNTKHDTESQNGAATGAWAVDWGVGAVANLKRHTLSLSPNWFGDFIGLNSFTDESTSITAYFINCAALNYQSNGCSGLGGGDYHLTAGANIFKSLVPAGMAVLPFDLDGVVRSNSGTGAAGAFAFSGETGGGVCTQTLLGVGC